MNNLLITYDWNFKLYTSETRLFELSQIGVISVTISRPNQYGQDYTYTTLAGELIASYYKDDHFGHGSQATGIELKNAIPFIVLPNHAEHTPNGVIRNKKVN